MPTYSLSAGVPEKLFDANSVAAPVNSDIFAIPGKAAKIISWSTSFASAPSAVSIKIQVANDVAGPWLDLDTGTATAGETRNTAATSAPFVRARKETQTGGGALTVTVNVGI